VVEEAKLTQQPEGLAASTEGWFVVNVQDAAWVHNDVLGSACVIETDPAPFEQVGYTIAILEPGQSGGRYHWEGNQEDFLVLQGECLLVIEGEERHLKQWDFVHCPPHAEHGFVGAGDGPCVIFMCGSRVSKEVLYVRDEVALKHGVGVEVETPLSKEAYAPFPKWQPGKPESLGGTPWG
jgi:uncharacterized cupin superfamily protein